MKGSSQTEVVLFLCKLFDITYNYLFSIKVIAIKFEFLTQKIVIRYKNMGRTKMTTKELLEKLELIQKLKCETPTDKECKPGMSQTFI